MRKPTFRAGCTNGTTSRSLCSSRTRRRDPATVLLLDTWDIGEMSIIDRLLASLTRLSGTQYRRDLLKHRRMHLFDASPIRVGSRNGDRGEPGAS
ncbi:MAG TPA: hypothetical protein VEL31_09855 [Ktedonobacteraceae bacterium]|nr:hypothetical protein [Ktedonobacteraceae bacterium]